MWENEIDSSKANDNEGVAQENWDKLVIAVWRFKQNLINNGYYQHSFACKVTGLLSYLLSGKRHHLPKFIYRFILLHKFKSFRVCFSEPHSKWVELARARFEAFLEPIVSSARAPNFFVSAFIFILNTGSHFCCTNFFWGMKSDLDLTGMTS